MPSYAVDIVVRAYLKAEDFEVAKQVADEIAKSIVDDKVKPHNLISSSEVAVPMLFSEGSEDSFINRSAFTIVEVEGALCAWEWMCEKRDVSPYKEMFEGHGSSAMRFVSIQAGKICCDVHDHMERQGYEHTGSYDWEFVPCVLALLDWDALIHDNQYGGPAYNPDIGGIFTALFAADKARHDPDRRLFAKYPTPLSPLIQWLERCRAEAKKQWAYAELIDDHIERAHEAHMAEQDPAEFVKWLGEKCDLTPAGEWGYA